MSSKSCKRLIILAVCMILLSFGVIGCSKKVGPNRKNDALKRAKEYVLEKYNEELMKPKVTRCTKSGEKLTYNSSYIIVDEGLEIPYNIVVDYNSEGEFMDIGDDRETEEIIADFKEWIEYDKFEPTAYIFGEIVSGGGENTIEETINYFYDKYNGDIVDYIKKHESTIYLTYDLQNNRFNDVIKRKLKEIAPECKASFEVSTSVTKKYNMGLSVAVPADNISLITLKDGKVECTELNKVSKRLENNIIASSYIDEIYKNVIKEATNIHNSQKAYINESDILEEKAKNVKDENGNNIERTYVVSGVFEGNIELAFSRRSYGENDVKVFDDKLNMVKPEISNDKFYYDDNYFYYLVKPGYVIGFVN